jgi:riboflavin synthase
MFTGIVTHVVAIKKSSQTSKGLTLTFERPVEWTDLVLGESIATNGVCLTVSGMQDAAYDCFLMPETLEKSSFGVQVPTQVNLERSLTASGKFGGHFVQGHVDGRGTVTKIDTTDGYRMYVEFSHASEKYVISKGSIAINGVSLTVAEVSGNTLSVALIPHTLEHTTLGALGVGDVVNLEFDMIGKYIVKNMEARQ